MTITILYDNNSSDPHLRSDWGFSCLIEGMEETILFDTGAKGEILLSNMKHLALDPHEVESIFLSHDHWDHTGGLRDMLSLAPEARVVVPTSFAQEFGKEIQVPEDRYFRIEKPTEICADVYSTGTLGTALKEQSMVIRSARGLVVITGCAHPGIVNILKSVQEQFDERIYMAFGGFHLGGYFGRELDVIVSGVKELGITKVGPCHCSSDKAEEAFQKEFAEDFVELGVGVRIESILV
jgi:7,8-dihydropterin-6-yl-methyl-4-(beta-D-ribofuranosyl)aminobenzene 5'-phosphate synthase